MSASAPSCNLPFWRAAGVTPVAPPRHRPRGRDQTQFASLRAQVASGVIVLLAQFLHQAIEVESHVEAGKA